MEKQESQYNMIDWWKKVFLRNYTNFSGRARRAEYWNFVLVNFIFYIACIILGSFVVASLDTELTDSLFFMTFCLVALVMLIPSLGVLVRRLHDTNRSGWYILFYFIPLVGGILLLVFLFTDGDRFPNKYGDDPKNPGIPELEFTGQ